MHFNKGKTTRRVAERGSYSCAGDGMTKLCDEPLAALHLQEGNMFCTAALLLSLLFTFTGCLSSTPAEAPSAPAAPEAAPAEPSTAPVGQTESSEPPSVQLQTMDWESTLALIPKSAGKVVVVDLWATYCPPCIAEFPNLVQLQKRYPDRVSCIAVSADYEGLEGRSVESYRDRVMNFLRKQNSICTNILLSTDTETLFREKIQQQSLPAVFVYDQQGQLAGQFPDPRDPGEFTYRDQILPLVEKLLGTE
jgi:thiol-disulfide isomerase/thioredoxin